MTHHWLENDLPAWYKLRSLTNGFEIVVHKAAQEGVDHHLRPESPLVKAQQERFPYLAPFLSCAKKRDNGESSCEEHPCGFGGTLIRVEDPLSDWVTYRGTLPFARRHSDANADMLEQCASLRVLLSAVSSFEGSTHAPSRQLMVVTKIFGGIGSAGDETLRVILTPTATKWISASGYAGAWAAMENTMFRALGHMRGRLPSSLCSVSRAQPAGLTMTLPGGATLTVDDSIPCDPSKGCVLVSDTMRSYEQLAFFVGLCRLHDLMRPRTTRELPAIVVT